MLIIFWFFNINYSVRAEMYVMTESPADLSLQKKIINFATFNVGYLNY